MSSSTPSEEERAIPPIAMSLKEAAQTISVSTEHLRNHLPEIPHFYVGSRVLVPYKGLEEWANRRAQLNKENSDRIASSMLDDK